MKRSVKFVRLCLLFGNLEIINDNLILKLSVANWCHIHVTLLPEKLRCAMSTHLNPDSTLYVIMNCSNLLRLMPDSINEKDEAQLVIFQLVKSRVVE